MILFTEGSKDPETGGAGSEVYPTKGHPSRRQLQFIRIVGSRAIEKCLSMVLVGSIDGSAVDRGEVNMQHCYCI